MSQVSSRGFDPLSDEPAWLSLPIPVALPQHPIPPGQSPADQGKAEHQGPLPALLSSRRPGVQQLDPQERPYRSGPRGVAPSCGLQEKRTSLSQPLPFYALIEEVFIELP